MGLERERERERGVREREGKRGVRERESSFLASCSLFSFQTLCVVFCPDLDAV